MADKLSKYRRLNGKYLKDAEKLLKEQDYLQASEKFWGATAEITKALASKMNKDIRTHAQMWEFVEQLDRKHPELNLYNDFVFASYLHANFYEDDLPASVVERGAKTVRSYVRKIEKLIGE